VGRVSREDCFGRFRRETAGSDRLGSGSLAARVSVRVGWSELYGRLTGDWRGETRASGVAAAAGDGRSEETMGNGALGDAGEAGRGVLEEEEDNGERSASGICALRASHCGRGCSDGIWLDRSWYPFDGGGHRCRCALWYCALVG